MADKRVTLPKWLIEAGERPATPPMVYNTLPPSSSYLIDPYEADAFISDIIEVCERHGLWISGDHASLMIGRTSTKQHILDAITHD